MLNTLNVDNSPFDEGEIALLRKSVGQLDAAKSAWLSGYLAGRIAGTQLALPETAESFLLPAQPTASAQELPQLHILFGSQTGTGEGIAETLEFNAGQSGLSVKQQSLADLRPASLKKLKHAVFIISTHGEGDPPDDAIDIFEYLESDRAPRLEDLNFRILALGDRSYSQFCEAGRQLEALLLARGAKTFAERLECDLDYEDPAARWSGEVLDYLDALTPVSSKETTAAASTRLRVVPGNSQWSRNRPFQSTVERVQKITGLESSKDIYHLELSLQDSGIQYEPGDSLGVWALNDSVLVDHLLTELNIDPAAEVEDERSGHQLSIHELLTAHRELTRLNADTIRDWAERSGNRQLASSFNSLNEPERKSFIEQRQFIDLVMEYPATERAVVTATELGRLLLPLAPRSYSIASSRRLVDEEVHLTVATHYSNAIGTQRQGVASSYLNHHLQAGDEVRVYLESNRRFRLPQDGKAPVIMIAAGTGIAPYRAFLQQFESEGKSPDTWLIFGNPHLRTDFLYQREWLRWREKGVLTRIDAAFSRDQADKRYVQHIVREQAQQIDEWLSRGAHIYICGSLAMGREVESALADALSSSRGLDAAASAQVLAGLRRERRLLKDLY